MLAQLRNDRGQDLIEYALLGGLIAGTLVVASILILTGGIETMFDEISKCVSWGSDCAAAL